MTKLRVNPGICGLPTRVEVDRQGGKRFCVRLESECPMVQKLGEEMPDLELKDIFKPILENPVYHKASETLRHASCPVAPAIIKALEVEADMALRKDVHIEFVKEIGER